MILIYKIQFYVQIPVRGFSIKNSKILSSAYCDSSKPDRSTTRYFFDIASLDPII